MKRFFNTTGPCVPGKHYLLDASEWLRAERVSKIWEAVNPTYREVMVRSLSYNTQDHCTIHIVGA